MGMQLCWCPSACNSRQQAVWVLRASESYSGYRGQRNRSSICSIGATEKEDRSAFLKRGLLAAWHCGVDLLRVKMPCADTSLMNSSSRRPLYLHAASVFSTGVQCSTCGTSCLVRAAKALLSLCVIRTRSCASVCRAGNVGCTSGQLHRHFLLLGH